jgi:hypothetical protein
MSSTCSQALADLPGDSMLRECAQSHSARLSPTASASLPATGQAFPSTPTCATSPQRGLLPMESPGPMSSLGGSHAKTSATPVLALDLPENDPGCGLNSRVSLMSFDPDSSLWRTSQRSLTGELEPFSETFPESGMTRSGRLYPHAPWVLHMCDDECSLWPTPTASMDGRGFGIPLHENTGRYKLSTVRRVHALVGEHGWRIHPHFTEALMGFPTDASAIAQSETPLSPTSPNSSDAQS